MPTPYTGRLAPSPTGLLHLGHARTFWTAHQRARAAHGKLYLRDEDLDPMRSRPEFSAAMREDLHWLGLTWDAELRQSDRLPLYRAAMQQLLAAGHACTRRDRAHPTPAPHEDDDEPLYNNHCRPLLPTPLGSVILSGARSADSKDPGGPHLAPTAGTVFTLLPNTNYRLRTPDHQPIAFTDLHAGPQSFTPAVDFGDFLIWRKPLTSDPNDIGLPSYQLACAVDDALTHITEVVRGRDLLKSTARQILLQRALGYPTPAYFHCDLLCDASGLRLAKRHDALSLRALRASGLIPSQVLAMG